MVGLPTSVTFRRYNSSSTSDVQTQAHVTSLNASHTPVSKIGKSHTEQNKCHLIFVGSNEVSVGVRDACCEAVIADTSKKKKPPL